MKVPVSIPFLSDNDKKFANLALENAAISGIYGNYISDFEKKFAEYCGVKYSITCSNGTTAIHLALVSAGIKKGDEVLVSTLTNMATFFAVLYIGAIPVPVDVDYDTMNINPELLESKITSKTKAILVVHLFGHPVDMDPVALIARKYNLLIFEDCAEAHGAEYKTKKVGALSDVGCFSFFSNKIITSGEGGIITTNNKKIAKLASQLKNLSFGLKNRFMHDHVGFNYRMTNLQAALCLSQLDNIEFYIQRRKDIANFYKIHLSDLSDFIDFPIEKNWAKSVTWMYFIKLKKPLSNKRAIITDYLRAHEVETRNCFIPFNAQRIFIKDGLAKLNDCPVANKLSKVGFYLPTYVEIKDSQMLYVIKNLRKIIFEIIKN
jgi:perosamine synthetase